MISCDLRGGLGNQLFQIVATIAYCIKNKLPFIFPYSEMLNEHQTYWDTLFNKIKPYTTIHQNFPGAGPNEIRDLLYALPEYQEPSFSYNAIPKHNKLMLRGYFQSYKYSENITYQIHEMLDLKFRQLSIKTEFLDLFDCENTISIHFRTGGDYKEKQEIRPILPLEYYVNALKIINEPSKALVFCKREDNDVVLNHMEILRTQFPHITFVKVCDDIPDWKQFVIMTCCNVNIIANSTFSWWGAYLNNSIVFYPDTWFGPTMNNSVSDLFPGDWKEISCQKID